MEQKIKNGLVYISSNINEHKDMYVAHKWNNLATAKQVFNNLGLTNSLLNFPIADEVEMLNWEVCQLVYEKANQYIASGVCMKEELKIEYVGYAAMLLTEYWYCHSGDVSIEKVPYLSNCNFTDFKQGVLNYIGGSDHAWIKRAISDCAHDFLQKELQQNTRHFSDGPFLSPAGREIAWEDAASIMFTSCHVMAMQRLGFN